MLMFWYLKDEVNQHFRRKLKTRVAPLEKAWLYEDAVHPHADKNPRPITWKDPNIQGWRYIEPTFQRRWTPNNFIS